jgi:hypothetical protein
MDPVRLLLISSTAVLSLLLLIEWNQYSDSHQKQQSDLYAAAVLERPATEEKSSFSAIDEGIPSVSAPVTYADRNPRSERLVLSEHRRGEPHDFYGRRRHYWCLSP